MAIRIRCTECEKKISVDEDFVGGVCRCPYCKALVFVAGKITTRKKRRPSAPGGGRPSAPARKKEPVSVHEAASRSRPDDRSEVLKEAPRTRPVRPAAERPAPPAKPKTPTQTPTKPPKKQPPPQAPSETLPPEEMEVPKTQEELKELAEKQGRVHMADPVFLQGVVTLVLLGILVVMIGGAIFLGIQLYGDGNGETPGKPEDLTKRTIHGGQDGRVTIEAPVAYVVDAAADDADSMAYTALLVSESTKTLTTDDKYTIVVAGKDSPTLLDEDMVRADGKGTRAWSFLKGMQAVSGADVTAAVKRAAQTKPRSIILLSSRELKDQAGLVEALKASKAKIVIISVAPGWGAGAGYREASEQAGGQFRMIPQNWLDGLWDEVRPDEEL